jgi:hypothetical protein
MGRVVSRIIRGWDTCTTCGITAGSSGRVMKGSWAPGYASEFRSGGVGVWVALVSRVDERIMRVCAYATGRCTPSNGGWAPVSWVQRGIVSRFRSGGFRVMRTRFPSAGDCLDCAPRLSLSGSWLCPADGIMTGWQL